MRNVKPIIIRKQDVKAIASAIRSTGKAHSKLVAAFEVYDSRQSRVNAVFARMVKRYGKAAKKAIYAAAFKGMDSVQVLAVRPVVTLAWQAATGEKPKAPEHQAVRVPAEVRAAFKPSEKVKAALKAAGLRVVVKFVSI